MIQSDAASLPEPESYPGTNGPPLLDRDFKNLCTLIFDETGISLNDSKREMVCSRLGKRLRHHGFTSYGAYYQHLIKDDASGAERRELINSITTNKTDFFREPHHFAFLRDRVFPRLEERARAGAPRRLRIWCAASSTGEEPYTLAMTLREWQACSDWDIKVLASDIDTQVLAKAEAGIYAADRLEPVPAALRGKYFLRGAGENQGTVSARPELRDLLAFRRINLMDEPWPMKNKFDLIFCRNVIIYFNQETQRRLLERFAQYLQPDGYLVLGHSENLNWLTNVYTSLGNTIYQLRSRSRPSSIIRRAPGAPPPPPRPEPRLPEPSIDQPEHLRLPRQAIIVGEVFASREPACVTTLLGSCVAACLYDPVNRVGGMNHFMLPEGGTDEAASARYGVHAMELLINEIMKLGGDRRRFQAKLFGGGRVVRAASPIWNVSEKNIKFAKEFLATECIPVVGKCLGGQTGLQVRFLTHTGQAFVRPLDGSVAGDVAEQEEQFGRETAREIITPPSDQVTLF